MKNLTFLTNRSRLILTLIVLVVAVATATYYTSLNYLLTQKVPEQLYVGQLPENRTLKAGRVLDVPYVSQKPWYCSEASASMVLQYFGYNVSQDQVHDAGYDRFENMLPILQKYVKSRYASLNLKNLKKEIDKGKPVIIRVLVGRSLHSVVVVGYDKKYLYIHDPAIGPYLKTNPKILLEIWKPTGFKAIVFN